MSRQPDEGVEVLRAVWSAQGQSGADLAEAHGPGKACKRMADVGFDGFAPGDEDLRSAWRARLQREGKFNPAGGSVKDLVVGSTEAGSEPAPAQLRRDPAPGQLRRDPAQPEA